MNTMKNEYDFSKGKRGPIIKSEKTRITLYLDDEILSVFRERAEREGRGYQTLINEALKGVITPESVPVTEAALRRVLREEFRAAH
jgi:uncharacterized protein (DUF4415 family)